MMSAATAQAPAPGAWVLDHVAHCVPHIDAASGDVLRASGIPVHVLGSQRLLVELPAAVGGIMIFEPGDAGSPKFD